MGQQQKQYESHHTERQAVLLGLDTKIDGLDVAIASLTAEQHTLKRARHYIRSTHDAATGSSHDSTAPASSTLKSVIIPTYLSRSPTAGKSRSSLRQEVLIRNAMEREKSSSPPGSVGLLSSDEFEASFPGHNTSISNATIKGRCRDSDNGVGDDVRPSVEGMSSTTAENHSAPSSVTTAHAISRSTTPSPESEANKRGPSSRNSQGAHWQAKRATKRKLQENAAKARDARRKKMKEAISTKQAAET